MTHPYAIIVGRPFSAHPDSDVTTNRNPANQDDIIGTYARGGAGRVDEAVAAAMAALDDWAHASPQIRHDVLEKAGALIVERKDELGRLLAREEGKTIVEESPVQSSGNNSVVERGVQGIEGQIWAMLLALSKAQSRVHSACHGV